MIKKGKLFFRFLSMFFVLPMLFQTTSCGNETENITEDNQANTSSIVVPAKPGVGIGRVMPEVAEAKGITICIDPGHGFMDGGTGEGYLPDGLLEKDITLAIATKLSEDLVSLGYNTVMTHDGVNLPSAAIEDGIFNPTERVEYANSIVLDYFISIHVNSYDKDPNVSGTRIYYMENDIKVKEGSGIIADFLGKSIQNLMPEESVPVLIDQSKETYSYAVVRELKYPSALVEVGFCTNTSDVAKMVTDEWQEQYAQALANGINAYFTEYAE